MLAGIEVYTSNAGAQKLALNPGINGSVDYIHVRNIEGLGPVAATVNTQGFAQVDGEFFNGSQFGKRNIVMTLGLNPDFKIHTPSTLRRLVYQYFMPKQYVNLHFFSDDMEKVKIGGYVESCDPNLFSKDLEMQVSIVCPLPNFEGLDPVVVEGSGSTAKPWFDIPYLGSLPVGYELSISTGGAAYNGQFTITTQNQAKIERVFTFNGFVFEGGDLKLNSRTGEKDIKGDDGLSRIFTTIPGQVWPYLEPGLNQLKVVTGDGAFKTWKMTYFTQYGGL